MKSLHNKNFLTLLDYSPVEINYLIDLKKQARRSLA